MLNTKRIIEMAMKSQKAAAFGRRRSISTRAHGGEDEEVCSTSVASKGHLFVYAVDGKRFMVPLEYLSSNIFRELLRMSEEEFGLPSDGPITLPCDASCMKYIISLLRCKVSRDVERAVLTSMANSRCAAPLSSHGHKQPPPMLYGF